MKSRLACAWLVAALSACAPEEREAALLTMTPARGFNNLPLAVVISGRGLDGLVDERYDAPALDVRAEHAAWLGEVPLAAVTLVSSSSLEAVVPAGLAAGTYDLRVLRPDGAEVSLADAFVVDAFIDDGCAQDAVRVRSAAELAAAATAAAGASAVTTICVAAPIALTAGITLAAPGVILQATPDGRLLGSGLGAGINGLVVQGGSHRVEGVRFSSFPSSALRVEIGELTVDQSRFEACATAVTTIAGARNIAVRRSVFDDVGVGVSADRTLGVDIANNTFFQCDSGVLSERATITLRNNYFAETVIEAVRLTSVTLGAPAQANIFTPAVTCVGCTGFDATNQVRACGLRDPAAGDFRLQPTSACIDLGVDVGLPYLGSAPDIGAFEER